MANEPVNFNSTFQTAEQLFFDADKKIKLEQFAEAKNILLQAIELDPKFGPAYNHLGWLYDLKFRDYTKSEEMYKKALEYSPEYVPTYVNYAIVLNIVGKYDELKALLEKALTVPGTDKLGLNREYAVMFEKQEKYNDAIEYYMKALKQCWVNEDIDYYQRAIDRCKLKMATVSKMENK